MENSQKIKKIPIGDGLLFKISVDASGIAKGAIRLKMIKPGKIEPISKGTYGELYYKEAFTPEEKTAAAKALGKKVEEIFGATTTKALSDNGDNNKKLVESGTNIADLQGIMSPEKAGTVIQPGRSNPYSSSQIDQTMVNRLLTIIELQQQDMRTLINKIPDALGVAAKHIDEQERLRPEQRATR